ncbi:MAG: hypothetical protein ABIK15_10665 [Pseudomonadota bacterium]
MAIQTKDVFGVSSKPVLSYIERPSVDDKFVEALKSDKQIVVYGSSKQGKTALVTKHLPYEDNITVSVTPKTNVIDIYASILRQLGIKIKVSGQDSKGREAGMTVGMSFKALIPLFGSANAKLDANAKSQIGENQQYEEVPFNLELPQDISELVHRIKKEVVVIIENFHYLDDDKQQQLAFDLRTFQELGIQFIILGVWREKNRLIQFNGDLLDRVTEVPVEPWTEGEFHEVAEKGARELNIKIHENVISACTNASFSSIGVFQELIKRTCVLSGIEKKSMLTKDVENVEFVHTAVSSKASEYAGRHQRALESIAAGNVSTRSTDGVQPLFLPYYLVKMILETGYAGVGNGIRRATIQEKIQASHHRGTDVRASDLSNLLHNLAKLQSNKNISPPIIDYDKTNKILQIVDSTFYFFLRHANLEEIANEIPSPLE